MANLYPVNKLDEIFGAPPRPSDLVIRPAPNPPPAEKKQPAIPYKPLTREEADAIVAAKTKAYAGVDEKKRKEIDGVVAARMAAIGGIGDPNYFAPPPPPAPAVLQSQGLDDASPYEQIILGGGLGAFEGVKKGIEYKANQLRAAALGLTPTQEMKDEYGKNVGYDYARKGLDTLRKEAIASGYGVEPAVTPAEKPAGTPAATTAAAVPATGKSAAAVVAGGPSGPGGPAAAPDIYGAISKLSDKDFVQFMKDNPKIAGLGYVKDASGRMVRMAEDPAKKKAEPMTNAQLEAGHKILTGIGAVHQGIGARENAAATKEATVDHRRTQIEAKANETASKIIEVLSKDPTTDQANPELGFFKAKINKVPLPANLSKEDRDSYTQAMDAAWLPVKQRTLEFEQTKLGGKRKATEDEILRIARDYEKTRGWAF